MRNFVAFSRAAMRGALALMLVFTLVLGMHGQAYAVYPERPIRIIIGFGPGSGSDTQARLLVSRMEQNLPGQYVVEPRPGAAGLLAGDFVAHSAPDGYTLLLGTTTILLTLPMMNKRANYSSKDFVPIAGFATSPFVVYTANKPDKPKTLQELLERVKKDGGTFGSNGHGSFPHLITLLMLQKAGGAQATHVPYKASPQTLTDLAAGELLFTVDNPASAAPFMQNNSLRALAVTSAKRLASMPDVPTVAEVLGTDFDVTVWGVLFAPKGTPEPIISALESAVQKSLTDPVLKDRLRTMELDPFPLGSKDLQAYIGKQAPEWEGFIKATGLELND
jgi:tripartite-type tricarboxylate transporter receptor subunit TctC